MDTTKSTVLKEECPLFNGRSFKWWIANNYLENLAVEVHLQRIQIARSPASMTNKQ